jgi:hypothetical protein
LLAIRYLLREEDRAFREAEVRLGGQIIDPAAGDRAAPALAVANNRCHGSTD